MARKITTEQMRARRIIKNAINRVNNADELRNTEIYQNELLKLDRYGLTPYTKTNAKSLDSIIDELKENYNLDNVLKNLEKVKGQQAMYNTLERELYGKRTRESIGRSKEEIKQIRENLLKEYKARFNVNNFIDENIQAIYQYEQKHGNVISGNSKDKTYNRPEWSDITKMINTIQDNPKEYEVEDKNPIKEAEEKKKKRKAKTQKVLNNLPIK